MTLQDSLQIDAAAVSLEIQEAIRMFLRDMKRKGVVLGISGGVDSSVVVALCARAIGKDHVTGLFMPEPESSPESLELGQLLAGALDITTALEDIGGILRSAGCYSRRDAAIRTVIPEYGSGYRCKIVLPNLMENPAYQLFSLVVRSPAGVITRARLTLEAYLGIVAATNFKQRTRKMMEYHYADRLNYAVAGTSNLPEYDQGFFVKNGDGSADFKPIAHLYKSQIYALAEYLQIPEEIRRRVPTTDTYSLDQSQEEFFFGLPYDKVDIALRARDLGVAASDAASELGLTLEQTKTLYEMMDRKHRRARYLNLTPLMLHSK